MPDQKPQSNEKDIPDNWRRNAKPGGLHPVVTTLIGMALALAVFIALYFTEFSLTHLIWIVPALALSAFLVFSSSKKLRRK